MKTLGILAILIIIVGGIFIWSRGGESVPTDAPDAMVKEGDNMEDTSEVEGDRVAIDTEASVINWTGRKTLILNYEDTGTVRLKSGQAVINDGKFVGGNFVADMTTISAGTTGSGDGEDRLTSHLKSDDFFDVENHPESMFVITAVEERSDLAAENSTHLVTGNLTIKGITNVISFPANVTSVDGKWLISARMDIDRTLWDVRFGSGSFFENLGDNVIDDMITLDVRLVSVVEGTN